MSCPQTTSGNSPPFLCTVYNERRAGSHITYDIHLRKISLEQGNLTERKCCSLQVSLHKSSKGMHTCALVTCVLRDRLYKCTWRQTYKLLHKRGNKTHTHTRTSRRPGSWRSSSLDGSVSPPPPTVAAGTLPESHSHSQRPRAPHPWPPSPWTAVCTSQHLLTYRNEIISNKGHLSINYPCTRNASK